MFQIVQERPLVYSWIDAAVCRNPGPFPVLLHQFLPPGLSPPVAPHGGTIPGLPLQEVPWAWDPRLSESFLFPCSGPSSLLFTSYLLVLQFDDALHP